MEFVSDLVIICIFGGFVAIDTAAGWQFMFSQPLVACTLIGFMLGSPEIGLLMGILFQLPWLAEIPAGGTHTSEGNVGSLVGAGLAIHLLQKQVNTENIILVIALLWGVLVGWLGGKFVNSMRKRNVFFVYRADRAADDLDLTRISLLNIGGVGHAFLIGFFLIAISFSVGVLVVGKMAAFVPSYFDEPFAYSKIGMLALGVGTMLSMFLRKRNIAYFFIGIVLSLLILLIL
ncbi:hypothetical protein GF337_08030 [candidate division KSB1 bacterium]|nr:hypothetical protein [candidate division KSB1 bacterium]